MTTGTLKLKKFAQEGDMAHEYGPLRNVITSDGKIVEFDTDEIDVDLNNPLNIECQPSYDGTVNLIINDDKNPPRIINTRFSKIEDNKYKIINRNQLEQTNLYKEGEIDRQTRLFRNLNSIPKIDLLRVANAGQMLGGNYTFYIKFADDDYNQTDVVCESGIVSIFKGYPSKPESVQGALKDEKTDKSTTLQISNIDTSFSKFYLYFVRETSDTNGVSITKAGMITEPYMITSNSATVTITGFEDVTDISVEELNMQYNLVTAAKTQAQVQNMLFLGNVQGVVSNVKNLQNISYFIGVQLIAGGLDQTAASGTRTSIGWVNPKDYSIQDSDSFAQSEYYNPSNIYYNLGYWPDEIYRLGVVYIMNDDSLSPVFNLRGCNLTEIGGTNKIDGKLMNDDGTMNYVTRNAFLSTYDNTLGVFKNPDVSIFNYTEQKTCPLGYRMTLSEEVIQALTKEKVKGYFFVRQKRIPTSLCQGLSVSIDRNSYVPMLYDNKSKNYFTESFLSSTKSLKGSFREHKITTDRRQSSGLLSVDAMVESTLQSNLDGSEFTLKPCSSEDGTLNNLDRHFWVTQSDNYNSSKFSQASSVYVNADTSLKYVNGCGYSTKCGTGEDVSQFSFFETYNDSADNTKLVRGLYTPYIGVNKSLKNNVVYTIKVPNYSIANIHEYMEVRGRDNSPFFAISNRHELGTKSQAVDVMRGDCFTNTVTIRLNRNFIDSEVPLCDYIVDPDTWSKHYNGYANTSKSSDTDDDDEANQYDFYLMNRADINAVKLGMWVTFKCLSNYNLGLRCEDHHYTDEEALMGNPRSFYPLSDISTVSALKIAESTLLNAGYNSTLPDKRYFVAQDVPYIKELFDSRIMFSNVQENDAFRNAYRVFQGLSYKDIDRQYGAIVKFLPWDTNILCIFEHGVGLIPVNEKALIQTSTAQSIHMYGAGVIQNQITVISPDFGSIWAESIIRTPIGVYGVDTYAKKIWRFSKSGFETISDMRVQRFLNENIVLREQDKYPSIAALNVKTHYNNYKGDVMFTFYNIAQGKNWNLCYNERLGKWVTRYSWTPLYSENIDNIFYSLDQRRAEILSCVYNNKNCTYGLHSSDNEWVVGDSASTFVTDLSLVGYELADSFSCNITSVETSYLDNTDKEVSVIITDQNNIKQLFNTGFNSLSSNSYSTIESFFKSNYNAEVPAYFKVNLNVTMHIGAADANTNDSIGIVLDRSNYGTESQKETWTKLQKAFLENGFYVHGRAGIFNEIDYEDEDMTNQILPTKWYEKQEPFEFEFVVNGRVGLHKIFDNLVIVSNNVQPNEIEFEIEGDVYGFNKAGLFKSKAFDSNFDESGTVIQDREWAYCSSQNIRDSRSYIDVKNKTTQRFANCSIKWDQVLNSYNVQMLQKCKDINEYGRRLGNIQYKEGLWYLTIDPILFKEKSRTYTKEGVLKEEYDWSEIKSAKLRDKYVRIRIKYTGEDSVIITALKTIITNSFS